jgi:hypothetical protein
LSNSSLEKSNSLLIPWSKKKLGAEKSSFS